MFGYINVNRKELTEEGKKAYQAYYCGLCRKLKSSCGTKGQMLLAYDMTFLVVLLTGLYELENEESSFTCALHPAKRQTAFINEATAYAADMNVLLAYHNLLDDWRDEKNYPKKKFADSMEKDYHKIAAKYPRQVKALEEYMKNLAEAEENQEKNLDVVAGMSGEVLGDIFVWKDDDVWAEELRCMGFYMGKFIYLMDAYEDLEKDARKKEYNPLLSLKKEKGNEEFETLSRLLLTSMVSECAKSFERLPILLHADIIRNILYSGIWSRYDYIQMKKQKAEKKNGKIVKKKK